MALTFCDRGMASNSLQRVDSAAAKLPTIYIEMLLRSLASPGSPFGFLPFVDRSRQPSTAAPHPSMSSTPTSPAPSNAQSLFDQSSADVTLRTSDHVDFHVHSQILSQASPVFATMFELPQPKTPVAAAVPAGRPVVDVAEDSTALDTLLCFCYPVKSPMLGSAEAIEPVLKAALKYDMVWVTEILTASLLAVVPSSPLRVWAIGCRTKLEEIARRGAEALFQSLPADHGAELHELPGISRPTDLEGVSCGDYWRCLEYIRLRRAGTEPQAPLLKFSEAQRTWKLTAQMPQDEVKALMAELPFHRIPALDPTDHLPSPDITCISSEGDVLRAHQCILSLHSPILRQRISTLKAASPESELILTLDTDLDVLHYLLDLCYAVEDHLPYDLWTLSLILRAAQAYQMERIILTIISRWYEAAKLRPMWAYWCAERAELKWCAKYVAARIIVDTLACPQDWYALNYDTFTARAYHQLLVYHHSCRTAVREELRRAKDRWEKTVKLEDVSDHSTPSRSWMSDYIDQLETKMNGKPMVYRDCMDDVFGRSSGTGRSPWCSKTGKMTRELYEFMNSLPQKIEDAIVEVEWKF